MTPVRIPTGALTRPAGLAWLFLQCTGGEERKKRCVATISGAACNDREAGARRAGPPRQRKMGVRRRLRLLSDNGGPKRQEAARLAASPWSHVSLTPCSRQPSHPEGNLHSPSLFFLHSLSDMAGC